MSQRGIREKNRFDTNCTPYLLVATKRESSPRKGNRRQEKTIVAAKRESSPRKGNRRREKRIVAKKENRGTNNGGLRRKIVLTQTAPHSVCLCVQAAHLRLTQLSDKLDILTDLVSCWLQNEFGVLMASFRR